MMWPPTESRTDFIAAILAQTPYTSEEEWSRARGRTIRPCSPSCDYDSCTGWMQARARSMTGMYMEWSAEAMIDGEPYKSPMLWERNR